MPQSCQGGQRLRGFTQQIGKQHDQAGVSQHRRYPRQTSWQVSFTLRGQISQVCQHIGKVPAATSRRQTCMHFVSKRDQANGVLLHRHQITQRRSQADRVFELGHLLRLGETHRTAEVDNQITRQIRFRFEPFDIVLIGFRINQPVDQFRIVAAVVTPMLTELNRKSMKGAAV